MSSVQIDSKQQSQLANPGTRCFRRDFSGKLYAACSVSNSNVVDIYTSTDNGDSWTLAHSVDFGDKVSDIEILVDSVGYIHCFITRYNPNFNIRWAVFNGSSWSAPTQIETTLVNRISASLDSSDNVHLVFAATAGVAYHKVWTKSTSSWGAKSTILTYSNSVGDITCAMSSGGTLHVATRGNDGGSEYIKYTKKTSGSWASPETVGTTGAFSLTMALSPSGDPWLVWSKSLSAYTRNVYCSHRDASGWASEVAVSEVSSSNDQRNPTIAIDASGDVHVVWEGYSTVGPRYCYRYRKYSSGAWSSISDIDDTGNVKGLVPKLLWATFPRSGSNSPNIPVSGFAMIRESSYHIYYFKPNTDCPSGSPPSPPEYYAFSFIACCNYNGQFLIGGITSVGTEAKYSQWQLNTVAWSQIGRWDLDYGSDTSKTAGFRHMPFGGTVLKLHKLGNRVVVHGTNGMAFMKHFSEPLPGGWGLEVLDMPGIASGFHCAGDDSVYGFIDFNNYWWTCTADGKPVKWGYKEFIESLSGTIKVSYLPSKQRFYITDGSTCYMFSQYGMCSIGQMVRSAGVYDGSECASAVAGSDLDFRVMSDTMDYGTRGLKTLTTMEASIDTESGVVVKLAVDYRYDKTASFVRSDWVQTNKRGGVGIMKTALEFRLGVLVPAIGSAPPEVNLDYILATIQISDRSMIRGVFAQQGGEDVTPDNA